jgi:glycosyltransferase involved in cell wall biosynthesis
VSTARRRGSSDIDGKWYDGCGALTSSTSDKFHVQRCQGPTTCCSSGDPSGERAYRPSAAIADELKATGSSSLGPGALDVSPGRIGPGGEGLEGCEYVGEVGPEVRAALLSRAHALIAPTVYIEPFGNVVVEAQASGTPTLTTDWGAFTETNVNGVTGYRCRTLKEFVEGVNKVAGLDRMAIRDRAMQKYSAPSVALDFERHFDRLYSLWGVGWTSLT